MDQSEVSKQHIILSQLKAYENHKLAKAVSLRRTSSTAFLHIFSRHSSMDENDFTQENEFIQLRGITGNFRSRMMNVLTLLATSEK